MIRVLIDIPVKEPLKQSYHNIAFYIQFKSSEVQCKTIVLNLNQINGVDTAVELAAKSQLGRQWLAAKEIIYELQKNP